mmetsp:Transcript_4583/g.11202  ORF Transcript_4583/g.11202 Transcript_4583/m.11202 type:complete len:246 (-) Transcript_4583:1650-2387(-)
MVAEGEAEARGGYAPGGAVPTSYHGGTGEPSVKRKIPLPASTRPLILGRLMPRRRQSLLRRAQGLVLLQLIGIGAVFSSSAMITAIASSPTSLNITYTAAGDRLLCRPVLLFSLLSFFAFSRGFSLFVFRHELFQQVLELFFLLLRLHVPLHQPLPQPRQPPLLHRLGLQAHGFDLHDKLSGFEFLGEHGELFSAFLPPQRRRPLSVALHFHLDFLLRKRRYLVVAQIKLRQHLVLVQSVIWCCS